jgi:hypothetical protein
VRVSGYDSGNLTSDVASSSLAQIKHLIFIGFARGLISVKSEWRNQTKISPLVISHVNPDEKEHSAQDIPYGLAKYLASISWDIEGLEYYDTSKGGGLLGGELRKPQTPAEVLSSAASRIGRFRRVFDIPRNSPDLVRIKAAIEWWVDAVTNENQTISFLQYCLGLEALLGDEGGSSNRQPERGITERLSDRYAYLMGATQTEREEFRRNFSRMYKRRGNLVHQRETHLRRSEDADACWEAKGMLFSAIRAELNGYLKATDKR